jgi:hypothetical protein
MFGTTPSLLMNSFFGHAFAAILILGAMILILKHRFIYASLLFGWAVLSDFGAIWLIPGFFVLIVTQKTEDESYAKLCRDILIGASLGDNLNQLFWRRDSAIFFCLTTNAKSGE